MLTSIPVEFYPYVYPLGGLLLGVFTLIIYWKRPDLRRLIRMMSLILIPFGPLSEHLFFQDYWFPPDVIEFYIGNLRIISGDIILVLAAPPLITLIPFLFNLRIKNLEFVSMRKLALKIVIVESITAIIFALLFYLTDLNSIFCGILSTIIIGVPALVIRSDLIKQYLIGVVAFGAVTFTFYLLYQLVIGDDYLQAVWLLDHSVYSVTILGVKIPLTEILFGAFAGPFFAMLVLFLEPSLKYVRKTQVNSYN